MRSGDLQADNWIGRLGQVTRIPFPYRHPALAELALDAVAEPVNDNGTLYGIN